MRIVISSGHGKYIRGASGSPVPPQLDEVDEARRVVEQVAIYLRDTGNEVVTFHDNTSHDQGTNLNTIVNYHNSHLQPHDLDVSVHFNAYDGSAHGVECLYVTQEALARRVSAAIADVGFTDRGPKYRSDLKFLNSTDEPAILIETCFCDNTNDSNTYRSHFNDVCRAIAEAVGGVEVPIEPPGPEPEPPEPPPDGAKPVIGKGDTGPYVVELQGDLNTELAGCHLVVDGDFGSLTDSAVRDYQASRGLDVDGIVGPDTWSALDTHMPPYEPPGMPPKFTTAQQNAIAAIATGSAIARYSWRDRGVAPSGYMKGFALSFANVYRKYRMDYAPALEMGKRNSGNADKDVLAWYAAEFIRAGMTNTMDHPDTLRHLWAFLLGLGMRESSGQHCCGRDQSADNVTSDTAEAGLYQTSYNAHTCSSKFDDVMDDFSAGERTDNPQGFLDYFEDEVSCSSSDWQNYGSGNGELFQDMCKNQPAFACETAAIVLRKLRQHYGPVNRKEVELKREAEQMLQEVQTYIDSLA